MATVVNCAAYENGRRVTDLDIDDPEEMKVQPGRVIWIGLHEPTQDVLQKLQRYFRDIQMYLIHPSAQSLIATAIAQVELGLPMQAFGGRGK